MIDLQFLLKLRDMGVVLRAQDDRLICNAPKGSLTPEIVTLLKEQKDAILQLLKKAENSESELAGSIKANAFKGPPPLSFAQQRLWYLDQLQPGTTAYNMSWALRLTGPLDKQVLAQSINRVIERHAVLRTTFAIQENEPVQIISACLRIDLSTLPVPGTTPEEREAALSEIITSEAQIPFDLSKGPLIRAKLYQISDDSHIILLVIHHIVFDGWSFDVFMTELFQLYQAFLAGGHDPLPGITIQYSDYCFWQRHLFPQARLDHQLEYWKKRLAPRSRRLNMPFDRERPALQTYKGGQVAIEAPPDLIARARALARPQGASLYMLLLGVFNILLYRWTGQNSLCIGTPMAGRTMKETEPLIGFFVQTVVLGCDISDKISFLDYLVQVRESVLEAQANQDVPFERIVQALSTERDLSMTPLFQVFFNHVTSQLKASESYDQTALHAERFLPYQGEIESKFDLTFYVEEFWSKVNLRIVYNSDLFDTIRIEEFLAQYLLLLEQIIANPEESVGRYSLVTAAAQGKLPDLTRTLASTWSGSIPDRFSRHAQQRPAKMALIDSNLSLSYEELNKLSHVLSRKLLSHGIGRDDTVAVWGHRSAGLVVALLGILKAGAAFMILDPSYPASRLLHMIEDAGPLGLITLEAAGPLAPMIAEHPLQFHITLPHDKRGLVEFLPGGEDSAVATKIEPDQHAYIIFTSGTTGRPKGIVGTHRPLSHFLDWHSERFGFSSSDRFSMLSGLAHDPLLRDIFTPLWVGGTLCIPDPEQMLFPQHLNTWMGAAGVTVAHLTPALGHVLAEGAEALLPALRWLFFGGDALSRRTVEAVRSMAPAARCVNFYGTTETPQAMGYQLIPPDVANLPARIAVGRGIKDAQLTVLNAAGRPTGIGELGEIHVRTPYLSKGYLNDVELTAQKYIVNPYGGSDQDRLYKTGDLGRYLPDGNVMFHGRRDSQVSIRGFRIELKEIETILTRHASVHDCAVIAKERDSEDRYLAAFVVPEKNSHFSPDTLRKYLQQNLPAFMVPKSFVKLDAIPITPNAKVDFQRLETIKNEQIDTNSVELPQTEMQKRIAEIWKEVLKLENVSLNDNFFNIGGHSLLSIQVVTKFEKTTGLKMRPVELIYQTLSQLSANYEKTDNSHSHPDIYAKAKLSYRVIPKYFRIGEKQLFSCYHQPKTSDSRNIAVLLCYPIGQEYIKSHRAFVQLAIRIANCGFPVMRFDYFGTGDSAGNYEEISIDQLRIDVSDAIVELKSRSNKQLICLAGLRFGATLAAAVATDRADIDSLILWEPIISGKHHIDKLKISHANMLKYSYVDDKLASPEELLGYPVNFSLLDDISKINLIDSYKIPIRNILLLKSTSDSEIDMFKKQIGNSPTKFDYLESICPDVWAEEVFKQLVPSRLLDSVVSWIKRVYS
jgi:amino acid adenylation domain-containing protein